MTHEPWWRIFWIFLRLGCQAFGGPVAHLAFFREELVKRRGWIDEQGYAELIAFCQFLPGPSSSQVGMCLGLRRGGVVGMLAGWLGFTLPAAAVLTAGALLLPVLQAEFGSIAGPLRGVHAVVVAIIAWALWGMGRRLCAGPRRLGFALVAAAAILALELPGEQFLLLPVAGLAGWWLLRGEAEASGPAATAWKPPLRLAWLTLAVALVVVAGGVVLQATVPEAVAWRLVRGMFVAGATVFGGGHVVLPMLEEAVVPQLIDGTTFLAGYGLTQAMPGPIFTFSAFIGASAGAVDGAVTALVWAALAVIGIFAPSWLLVPGLLPIWERLRQAAAARAALDGIAAAVVGLLLAILWDPVLVSVTAAPGGGIAMALALLTFAALAIGKWPAWLLVIGGAVAGTGCELVGLAGWV